MYNPYKKLYTYSGHVFDENDHDLGEWSGATMATGRERAAANLKWKAKRDLNIPNDSYIYFSGTIIEK